MLHIYNISWSGEKDKTFSGLITGGQLFEIDDAGLLGLAVSDAEEVGGRIEVNELGGRGDSISARADRVRTSGAEQEEILGNHEAIEAERVRAGAGTDGGVASIDTDAIGSTSVDSVGGEKPSVELSDIVINGNVLGVDNGRGDIGIRVSRGVGEANSLAGISATYVVDFAVASDTDRLAGEIIELVIGDIGELLNDIVAQGRA